MITSTQMPQHPREVHATIKVHVFQATLRGRMVGDDDARYSEECRRSSYGAEVVRISDSIKQKK